jgi:two-component system chemotaxis response regulator CheY
MAPPLLFLIAETIMENTNMKKALIVDENITQRKTIASYLKAQFECTDCSSTVQALQLLHEHYYDIIITEMEFSMAVAESFLSEIKKIQNHVRVLMMTCNPDENTVFIAAKNDVDAILVKPLSQKSLFNKIQELLSVSFQPKKTLAMAASLSMRIQKVGTYAIISLAGRLLSSTFPRLKAGISNLLKRGVRNFALNMDKLIAIDQSGFRFILQTFKYLKQLSGSLCLFNVVNVLAALSSNTELAAIVPIYLEESEFKTSILKEYAHGMAYPHREG